MENAGKIRYIFINQFIDSLTHVHIWIGYLIGVVITLNGAYNYMCCSEGQNFQIFEPYILNLSSIQTVTFIMAGFLLIIYDALFIDNRSCFKGQGLERRQWFWGKCCYIIVHGICYYLVGLLSSCIFVRNQGYFQNNWSSIFLRAEEALSDGIKHTDNMLSLGGDIVNRFQPIEVTFHTVTLLLLYSIIIAITILFFNTRFNRIIGTAIAAAIHMSGYIVFFINFEKVIYWTLLFYSMFAFSIHIWKYIIFSYLILGLILVLLIFGSPQLLQKANLRKKSR